MNLKKCILLVFCVTYSFFICNAQVKPDSLIGTYVGEYWFYNWDNNPWEISENETVWIYSIDTSNCTLSFDRSFEEPYWYFSGWDDFETEYDFCNGQSPNFYKRFYAMDSLVMEVDFISPPPPDYDPISIRFYGKKISSTTPTSIQSAKPESECSFFPNPFQNEIHISFDNLKNRSVRLLTANGQSVFYGKVSTQNYSISTRDLATGIYCLQVLSSNSIDTFKLIKN